MKIVLMTGSHVRHAYLAQCISRTGAVAGIVIERREAMIPAPLPGIPSATKELFKEHFQGRADAESRYFGGCLIPSGGPVLETTAQGLNGSEVLGLMDRLQPDLILSVLRQ